MKTLFLSLTLSLSSLTAVAQVNPDSTEKSLKRAYVGLSLTTVTYHIYYKDGEELDGIKSGYFTPIALHAGYNLSDRLSIQIGVGYGGSKDKLEWSLNQNNNDPVKYRQYSKTNVLAVPVTAQMIFLKAFKRFPVYGTISMIPSFGFTKAETQEIRNGETTASNSSVNGMNLFATAGLGVNYKISSRFYGHAEYLFYKRNLTGQNSFHYDWEQYSPMGRRIYKSLGLGVNYKI
ncbi:outer membrane beta-barrel protein [Pontibacter sp. BT310]|uniref:Porin family protein n=1 Tax=Pontibacter populi TaxID=890055 RepID=A0ABS6XBB2_9BACT|nr:MULTISPECIES: outer membrane beta-barrel protein [Pontibacter]MBJ6117548.1 outer membrane beta-barrel protein [Pontibacter sp. BT310]MBR0569973.1 outer membrane beta-barrel protein [Microvirga sp. STS03]MBW3364401.1 porin family protein [Pontibacter populi]